MRGSTSTRALVSGDSCGMLKLTSKRNRCRSTSGRKLWKGLKTRIVAPGSTTRWAIVSMLGAKPLLSMKRRNTSLPAVSNRVSSMRSMPIRVVPWFSIAKSKLSDCVVSLASIQMSCGCATTRTGPADLLAAKWGRATPKYSAAAVMARTADPINTGLNESGIEEVRQFRRFQSHTLRTDKAARRVCATGRPNWVTVCRLGMTVRRGSARRTSSAVAGSASRRRHRQPCRLVFRAARVHERATIVLAVAGHRRRNSGV